MVPRPQRVMGKGNVRIPDSHRHGEALRAETARAPGASFHLRRASFCYFVNALV
jgi:hypothetical protein